MPARARFALLVAASLVLAGALAIVLTGPSSDPGAATGQFRGSLRPEGQRAPAFDLRDQDGRRVRSADLRGRPYVVTFLYSTCEDTCPTTASVIRSALVQAGVGLPVLAVSVDPANDTAARARRFLLERRLTGRMAFLLGSRAELAPVWDAYAIQPQGEDFEHSAYVLLVDARGRQRVSFPFGGLTTDALAHDLRLLAGAPDGP